MAISRLTITFNEDFENDDIISFEVYDSETTLTDTYSYICTNVPRVYQEFIQPTPLDTDGLATCESYMSAIFEDEGSVKWSLVQNSNSLQLTAVSDSSTFQNATTLLDVDFVYAEIPIETPKPSYYYEFEDLKGIEHRVEIKYNPSPTSWVEIKGNYTIENPSDDDILSPLRPKQVTCNLEADLDLNFEDIYTEEERIYKVTVIRGGDTIFIGWLSSDGLYENYVADKWIISLSAIDGLGYLDDISYINDDSSLYSGKQTDIEKLKIVLGKTELALGIRTCINIYYDGLSEVDILSNTNFNAERYYADDNNEPFTCKQILLSVLEKYNAVIVQDGGYWYIYRPNEVFNNADLTFYNYTSSGVLDGTYQKDITHNIGSQIDGFYPHFVNENQQKSLKRSLGAYRLNLKYGRVFPYYQNTLLNWDDSSTIDDWTILNSSFVSPCDSLQGIKVTNAASPTVVMESDTYTVDGTPRVQFQVTYSNLNDVNPVLGTGGAVFNAKIIYTKGANTYYLTRDGVWTTSDELIQYGIGVGEKNFVLKVVANNELPEADGDIKINLYDAGFGLAIYPLCIHNMSLQTYIGEDESQGAFYTIEKLVKSTPNTDNVKTVIHGDVPDNTYYSAIYENDETTNTENWYRKGYEESKPLLRIMIEDRLRMSYKPRVVFEGDVYGYIPLFSMINVNNVKNKMMCTEWGYDANTNITRLKIIELMNNEIQSIDVSYSVTEDYGNTVKPTIKS